MSTDNQVQTLIDFGLTATQARAYLCLSTLGTSNAKSISQCSKIPRQDIYRILNELFDIGLIEKLIAKPAEFRAMPPGDCLRLLVQRRNSETETLRNNLSKFFDAFHPMLNDRKQEIQTILIPPKEPILIKVEELVSSLTQSLRVMSPSKKLFPWIYTHQELLQEALKRGIKLQFVTMKSEGEALPKFLRNSKKNSLLEVKLIATRPAVSFGIYDNKRVILELSVETGFLESQVFISDNPCLVELASICFESVWNKPLRKSVI